MTAWAGAPIVTRELAPLAAHPTGTLPVGADLVQLPYTKEYCVSALVVKLLIKPAAGHPRVDRHSALAPSLA